MIKHSNYWFDTRSTKHSITSGIIRKADTLIIGGGMAGVLVLYNLINAGMLNTYLVEDSTIGSHAAGRTNGQLMLRSHKLFSEMENGEDYLKFVHENNKRFTFGLRHAKFDTDLRESGGLRLATTNRELYLLEQESLFIKDVIGLDCPILSGDEVSHLIPSDKFVGAMYNPSESTFNPYKVTHGIKEAAEQKGLRVLTNCGVESVNKRDDGTFDVIIRHKGIINAKRIVYCTNGYTPSIVPELSEIMMPFRDQMVATDALPDSVIRLMPAMSMGCATAQESFRMHYGRLIFGRRDAEQTNYDGEVDVNSYDKLYKFIQQYLPLITRIKFTHAWSSIICKTSDNLPLIGELPNRPNEFILGGFNGYGYSHVLLGSLMLKNMITQRTSFELFDPARFANEI